MLHRTAKAGLGAAYLARLRGRARARATTWWARWTPTARTSPSSCRRLLEALADADLVLGSRWVPGGTRRQLAAAPRGALARRQPLRPAAARHRRSTTRPPATGCSGVRRCETIDLATVRVGRATASRPTWRCAPLARGPPGARGADRVRRARARRVEDERRRRGRVAAPDHRVGAARARATRCAGRPAHAGGAGRRTAGGPDEAAPAVVAARVALRRRADPRDLRDHPARPGRSAPWWTILLLDRRRRPRLLADQARGRPRLAGAAGGPGDGPDARHASSPTGRSSWSAARCC